MSARQPMRARKIRDHEGAVVYIKQHSRQVELRDALAEQTGSRR